MVGRIKKITIDLLQESKGEDEIYTEETWHLITKVKNAMDGKQKTKTW